METLRVKTGRRTQLVDVTTAVERFVGLADASIQIPTTTVPLIWPIGLIVQPPTQPRWFSVLLMTRELVR